MKVVTSYKLLIIAVFTCTITILFYLCLVLIRNEHYSTNFRAFDDTEVETSLNQIGEFSKFKINISIIIIYKIETIGRILLYELSVYITLNRSRNLFGSVNCLLLKYFGTVILEKNAECSFFGF